MDKKFQIKIMKRNILLVIFKKHSYTESAVRELARTDIRGSAEIRKPTKTLAITLLRVECTVNVVSWLWRDEGERRDEKKDNT